MEVILGIIILVIIFSVVSSISKGAQRASDARQYQKAIERSTGLEKVRLLVRQNSILYHNLFQHENANDFSIGIPVMEAHMSISDIFYSQISETASNVKPEVEEALSEAILQEGNISLVSSRIFGISFGLFLKKSADEAGKKINQTKVKEYISTCKLSNDETRKEISKFTLLTVKHLSGFMADEPFGSLELSELTDGILCIKREKGNFTDPLFSMALAMALKFSYARMNTSLYLDNIQKTNLLK